MDEPTPPTARDLGISERDYERILRDLGQRRGVAPPVTAHAQLHRPGGGWRLVVVGVVVIIGLVVLLSRIIADGSGPTPAYAFLDTVEGGDPVTHSTCRPLQVAVYPAGGPPDAEQLVREAVSGVRRATGLDIVVVGAYGGHAPNWNFEAAPVHPDDPVSVSWQDGDAIAELTDDVAGLGGSPVFTHPNGTRRRVAGTIALSRDYYTVLDERGDHAQAVAVLLHEFGHVVGLDHVDSSDELMHGDLSDRTTFGDGDLEGLRRIGQGPCF